MKRALIPAAVALLALPATSLAHDATVVCNPAGGYITTADYQHLSPVVSYGPSTVSVRWSDGYVRTIALPAPCTVPPPPVEPPAPPAPEQPVVPVVGTPFAPPVVSPGGPVEPQPRVRPRPKKAVRVTCKLLNQRRAGVREYTSRGWYFRCKAPAPPRKGKPFVPEVTG